MIEKTDVLHKSSWCRDKDRSVVEKNKDKNPRKGFSRFSVGENVVATCFGFPCLIDAVILDIGDDKKVFEKYFPLIKTFWFIPRKMGRIFSNSISHSINRLK